MVVMNLVVFSHQDIGGVGRNLMVFPLLLGNQYLNVCDPGLRCPVRAAHGRVMATLI